MNDVHYLDLKTMTWHQPQIAGTPPSARAGHTCAVVWPDTNILIFGGGYIDKVYNDVHMLNTEKLTWSRPADTGNVPSPRTGHSMNVLEGRIFVFGGCDSQGLMYNDIHILDASYFRVQFYTPIPSAPQSPANMKNSPSNMTDFFQDSITVTEEQSNIFSSTIDSTTERVTTMLGKVETQIKEKQADLKLNQTKLITYVKNYHKDYENEFNKLRSEVVNLKNIVITELADIKSQLMGLLKQNIKKRAPENDFGEMNIPPRATLVHRRSTQPSIPGAPPRPEGDNNQESFPVSENYNDEKEAEPVMDQENVMLDLSGLTQVSQIPIPMAMASTNSFGSPGNSLLHFIPPPNQSNPTTPITHDAMIFSENFEAQEVMDDSSSYSLSGDSRSSSLSVPSSPVSSRSVSPKKYTPSQHLNMLMARDFKDGDIPQKKKRRRRRKKNKKERRNQIRSAPSSPRQRNYFQNFQQPQFQL